MRKIKHLRNLTAARTLVIAFIILILAAGITHAAMRIIQLNSSATFPVDI